MKKIVAAILLTGLCAQSHAASNLTLVKVKELGPMKNKVVFQSKSVKKVKGTNIVTGKLIAQWGVHVFEVVNGYYTCNTKNVCKLTDYERVATYESCTIKKQTAKCSKKLSGDDSSIEESTRDITVSPDGVQDERDGHTDPRDSIDEVNDEFGSNINAEADII